MAQQAGSLPCRIKPWSKPLNVKDSLIAGPFPWQFLGCVVQCSCRRGVTCSLSCLLPAGWGRRTPSAGRTLFWAGLTSRRSTASSAARGTTTAKVRACCSSWAGLNPPVQHFASCDWEVFWPQVKDPFWLLVFLSLRERKWNLFKW